MSVYLKASKSKVSQCMRNPSIIIDPRLGYEISRFVNMMTLIPYSFSDENQLRNDCYDKTPDILLEIPIEVKTALNQARSRTTSISDYLSLHSLKPAVDGKVVNWIESKGSFGDHDNHEGYLKSQYWSYQNRYGPGIVIYWFGFIEELNIYCDKGITVIDHIPDRERITFLRLPASCLGSDRISVSSSKLESAVKVEVFSRMSSAIVSEVSSLLAVDRNELFRVAKVLLIRHLLVVALDPYAVMSSGFSLWDVLGGNTMMDSPFQLCQYQANGLLLITPVVIPLATRGVYTRDIKEQERTATGQLYEMWSHVSAALLSCPHDQLRLASTTDRV
ncbi:hypothetical protein GQR58_015147 [Nymphon striatum]|nr:hypothetical protein GQR58_015147 [Nymphon striatum]